MRRTRRGCLAVFALLIGLIAGTTPPAARSSELEIATQPISYDALAKVVRDLKGKVVIVDFWAEYCSPCKEELKELLVLQKKYGHDSLALLTVSLDDPKDKEARDRIGDFLTQQQADCTSYILDTGWQEWQKKLKIAGPPCLYLFNRENYYVRKFTGEINPEVIKSEIAELINGRTSDKNAAASDELIDFRVAVLPPDPFSERNQFGRPVTFQRGEVATIVLNGMPKPGYHTYPLTQRTTSQSPGTLSRWQFVETANLRPLWPITETRPRFKQERTKDVLLEVEGAFTWSRDILILPDARPASTVLSSTIQLTACNEDTKTPCAYKSTTCIPPSSTCWPPARRCGSSRSDWKAWSKSPQPRASNSRAGASLKRT